MRKRAGTIDEYIEDYPREVQQLLQQIRLTIRKVAPKAEETISYSMPAFKQNGILVWFAAFKNHIGFYPGASGIAHFKKELLGFKGAKGSVQFPIDKPLPLALVGRIVRFRVAEKMKSQKTK
jgi:uncharacterized protein YdhG (YjbR/CyaY superfamily)